jgi:uncharacterized membrane protein YphA (DoxX/SURF4 family)
MPGKLRERFYPKGREPGGRLSVKKARNLSHQDPLARPTTNGRMPAMNTSAPEPLWRSLAALLGRLIFAGVFVLAAAFKFMGMQDTAGYIAGAGFPIPLLLAWAAAIFESLLVLAFLTGLLFAEAALLAAVYVLFLAFAFHGPAHWGNQAEFGFFIDHFTFIAGLLFAAVHGPGRWAPRGRI